MTGTCPTELKDTYAVILGDELSRRLLDSPDANEQTGQDFDVLCGRLYGECAVLRPNHLKLAHEAITHLQKGGQLDAEAGHFCLELYGITVTDFSEQCPYVLGTYDADQLRLPLFAA